MDLRCRCRRTCTEYDMCISQQSFNVQLADDLLLTVGNVVEVQLFWIRRYDSVVFSVFLICNECIQNVYHMTGVLNVGGRMSAFVFRTTELLYCCSTTQAFPRDRFWWIDSLRRRGGYEGGGRRGGEGRRSVRISRCDMLLPTGKYTCAFQRGCGISL